MFKGKIKRFLSAAVLMVALIALFAVSAAAAEITDSGSFGSGLSWELDSDGVLTISGEGQIPNYDPATPAPWAEHNDEIWSVVIDEGITTIGSYAFFQCPMQLIELPESVTHIRDCAFRDCDYLEVVVIPRNVVRLGDAVFADCDSLVIALISGSVQEIPVETFASCESLMYVTISEGLKTIGPRAFSDCRLLREIMIPSSVRVIQDSAFLFDAGLSTVWYTGSASAWSEITKDKGNDVLKSAAVHCDYAENHVHVPLEIKTENVVPATRESEGSYDSVTLCGICGKEISRERVVTPKLIPSSYIDLAYQVILERHADAAGLAHWEALLESGSSAGAVINECFRSEEYRQKGEAPELTVARCYLAMLGRVPNQEELANWTALLRDGYSVTRLVSEFTASEEFGRVCDAYGLTKGVIPLSPRDRNGNITRFVERCYRLTLDRAPDEDGLNEWCAHLLEQDLTPERVAFGFVFSNEAKSRALDDEAFITMLYQMMLDREPDEGAENWVASLTSLTEAEVAWAEASGERTADDAVDFSRQTIYASFAASEEFGLMIRNFGF